MKCREETVPTAWPQPAQAGAWVLPQSLGRLGLADCLSKGMCRMRADELLQQQIKFYNSGMTKDYYYRIESLKK